MAHPTRQRKTFTKVVALVLFVLVTGCTKDSQDTTLPTAMWSEDYVTFTDPALGISLDFPRDWTILPRTSEWSEVIDTFFSPCNMFTPDVLPPCTKIQIQLAETQADSFEEMKTLLEERRQASEGIQVLESGEFELNGLPAIWDKLVPRGGSENPMLHAEILIDNRIVYFNAYGSLDPVEDILNTIRQK